MPAPFKSAPETDEALMLRVRDADSSEALGELYDRHARLALRIAWSICRDAGRAEEAVQEGFEGVWHSRATYDQRRGPVAVWVMSIVRYRALGLVKRRDTATIVERAGERLAVGSPPEQLVDDVVTQSEGQELRDALKRLPAAQRQVITLAFYGELSHSEIAEHLALPTGTVKGRMRLGLHKLRTAMDERDIGPAKPDSSAA